MYISNAYLNSELQETVFMEEPENFTSEKYPNRVLRLKIHCNRSKTVHQKNLLKRYKMVLRHSLHTIRLRIPNWLPHLPHWLII